MPDGDARDPTGETIGARAAALSQAGASRAAYEVYRSNPWALADWAHASAFVHIAATAGEMETVRELVASRDDLAEITVEDATARLARFDAVRPVTPLDSGDLRGWDFVLHGTVLLHVEESGDDEPHPLGGRLEDLTLSQSHVAGIVDMLLGVLRVTGRTPTTVTTVEDRDSLILAATIASMLGIRELRVIDGPCDLSSAELFVVFDWSAADQELIEELDEEPAVTFAVGVDWTRQQTAPDIAYAQATRSHAPWELTDDRPVEVVAADAAQWQLADVDTASWDAEAAAVLSIVTMALADRVPCGLLSATRSLFYPGGPVAAARATGNQTADVLTLVADRYAASTGLFREGLITSLPCAACGFPTVSGQLHEICWFCHWEDDGYGQADPDDPSGPNHGLTLREATRCVVAYDVAEIRDGAMTPPEYFVDDAVRARTRARALLETGLREGFSEEIRLRIAVAREDLETAIMAAFSAHRGE